MYIVVGLGNPEKKYEHTRHNVGFDVLNVLSQQENIPINKSRCKALTGEGNIAGQKTVLAAPQTYMNLSGEAVVQLMNWYKVDAKHVIIVYDDVDLAAGKLRVRANGSAGTHNGMRSVIGLLGRQDFPRLRVGVGKKPEGWELADWVLSHYQTEADRKTQFDAFLRAADGVDENPGAERVCGVVHSTERARPRPGVERPPWAKPRSSPD